MTALTAERNTPTRDGNTYTFPVAANKKILAGSLTVLDASGNAAPASTATGLKGAGRASETVDNTGGSAGAVSVTVERGVYLYANDGSVTRAHIGSPAYVVDDQTVAATDGTGTRSAVATVRDIDSAGVWIEI
jgi:hypothetical protein